MARKEKVYRVNFEYEGVALECTTYLDASDSEEALATGQERIEISEGTPGTWSVEEDEKSWWKFW